MSNCGGRIEWFISSSDEPEQSVVPLHIIPMLGHFVHWQQFCAEYDGQIVCKYLEEVDYKKILGVIVDDRLSFIKHVDYVEKKCQKRLHWLRVLKRNGVKATHLINLYLTMIRSTLTYAAEAWYGYLSKTQKDRLEKVQRIALKYILPNIAYNDALVKLKLSSL